MVIVKYYLQLFINLVLHGLMRTSLNFTDRSTFAGDLKAAYPFWTSSVSNSSGYKLLVLFDAKKIPNFSTIPHSLLSYGKW
jgi:hypothetical protein